MQIRSAVIFIPVSAVSALLLDHLHLILTHTSCRHMASIFLLNDIVKRSGIPGSRPSGVCDVLVDCQCMTETHIRML